MIRFLDSKVLKKFRNKTCLLRIDLNIELGEEKNSFRLHSVIPTIKLLLRHKIKVVILSHRGRPRRYDKKLSLRPFTSILKKKLRQNISFTKVLPQKIVSSEVTLMENLRFWRGEENNDLSFGYRLARLGDFYINDAFAVSHRKNASVVAITRYLPSYGGPLLEKEIKNLSSIMKNPKKPFVIIIGGAKIKDKLGVIKYFWSPKHRRADYFLLGGGPANTFFAAQGMPVGNSLVDKDSISQILTLIPNKVKPPRIVLPVDVKIKDKKILDIGPRTVLWYRTIIKKCRTIIWNGPMGFFEKEEFAEGTKGVWRAVLTNRKARIVVGGGETVASLRKFEIRNSEFKIGRNVFISTGGGAMLEYLAGKKLPGIKALEISNN